jgi:site-specific DNA recombinase
MRSTAIYARKSSESEDRQILSIDSQVKELKEFASREKLVVDRVFTESKSAKAPGRPVFDEVFRLIEKGEIGAIVCWKLDRLARNPVDGGAVIWAMEEKRLERIMTPQRTFVNTGNDKFWMQLEFGMAKKYVDDLSDNVKRGLRARLASGWLPGLPPLGYLNDRNSRTVVRDPERFPLVRRMWDMLLSEEFSPLQILETANEEWGFRTRQFKRQGGRPLSRASLYKLFGNPFYYGAILSSGEIHAGKHDAMISPQEFEKAQRILKRGDRPRPGRHSFAYTGLIKCGECGGSITAEHKYNAYGRHYVYYHCTKRVKGKQCSQGVIDERVLERQIEEILDSISVSDNFRVWAISILRELHEEESAKDKLTFESLNRRYEACKIELSKLLDLKLRDLLTDADYVSKKNQLENERLRLKELLNDSDDHYTQVLKRCEEVFDFAGFARRRFTKGTADEKKAVLAFTGSNFTLQDGILRFHVQKPLLLIQKAFAHDDSRRLMIELPEVREDKRQSAAEQKAIQSWCGLVDDVRTFFLKEAMRNLVVDRYRSM